MDSVLLRYLLDLKIEISPYTTFVTVGEHDSIQTVLNKMAGNKILSLPVNCTVSGQKRWIMVDLLQITRALIPQSGNIDHFFSQPISSVMDYQAENPSLELENDPNLLDLVKLLGTGKYHRILITRDYKPVGLLSQMDVIRFIGKNLHLIPEKLRHTAIHNLAQPGVVSVKESDNLLNALKVICDHNFYGVAVVNDNNQIVGNLSVSDLRGCSSDELKQSFKLSVHGFFQKTKYFLKKDPVKCSSSENFENVMLTLVHKHVHRTYISDKNDVPVSVFSASDAVNHILVCTVSAATF